MSIYQRSLRSAAVVSYSSVNSGSPTCSLEIDSQPKDINNPKGYHTPVSTLRPSITQNQSAIPPGIFCPLLMANDNHPYAAHPHTHKPRHGGICTLGHALLTVLHSHFIAELMLITLKEVEHLLEHAACWTRLCSGGNWARNRWCKEMGDMCHVYFWPCVFLAMCVSTKQENPTLAFPALPKWASMPVYTHLFKAAIIKQKPAAAAAVHQAPTWG